MSVCPYCGLAISVLDAGDEAWREIEHMNAEHPDIVEARLVNAGFRRGADGEWVDTLAAED